MSILVFENVGPSSATSGRQLVMTLIEVFFGSRFCPFHCVLHAVVVGVVYEAIGCFTIEIEAFQLVRMSEYWVDADQVQRSLSVWSWLIHVSFGVCCCLR
jgi:hypothetical protein